MPFHVFNNSTTAYANEVMDNFYWIADGNRLPRSGQSLTTTDSVWDLGSSTKYWNNLYTNNLIINSALTSTTLLNKVAQLTYNGATTGSNFTISGLNGDNSNFIFSIQFDYGATSPVQFVFNQDSGTNYSYKALANDSGSSLIYQTASSADSNFQIDFDFVSGRAFVWGEIYSKTGTDRIVKIKGYNDVLFYVGIWSNTTDTLTSIKFFFETATAFTKFTKVTFWGMP